MRKQRINRTMALFLLSYITVMLLPLSIGILYYYPQMRSMLIEHATERSRSNVRQLSASMDEQLSNVYGMPGFISTNKNIIEYELRTNPLARRDAKDQLNQMIRTNTFIDELFLYIRDAEYLIGARTGAYYFSNLTDHPSLYQTSFGDISNETLQGLLHQADRAIVLQSRNVMLSGTRYGRMLLFVLPVPQRSFAHSTALICVSESRLNDLINVHLETRDSRFLLFGEGNALLHANSAVDTADILRINEMLADAGKASGTMQLALSGEKTLMSWSTSSQYGWRYVNLVPLRAITLEADRLERSSTWITIGIIALSALCIYVAMRVNYLPIQKLARLAQQEPVPLERRDDIQAIQRLIQRLHTDVAHLDERIHQSEPQLREYLVGLAIRGEISDTQGFLRQSMQIGLDFEKAPYMVMLAVYEDTQAAQDALARISEQEIEADMNCIATNGDKEECIAIILSGGDNASLSQEADGLLGDTKMRAIGGVVYTVGDIAESYRQADAALDYLMLNNITGGQMRYEELPERVFKPRDYPTNLMQALEITIQHGDAERMAKLVRQITALITHEGAPPYFTRSVYFNTANLLIGGLHRHLGSDNETVHEIGIRSMLNHYNVNEMVSILESTSAQLSLLMEDKAKAHSSMTGILAYIEENIASTELSLVSAADAFGLSASAFSRMFKEKIGRNFKEYVDTARIALAKTLLTESRQPVEQVALSVGYENITSFYRLFKKHVGIAPGEYRQAKEAPKSSDSQEL